MGKKYTKEMHEAYRKEQDEKAAKEEQDRQDRQERTEKETARRAWVADGGSAGDFEKAWPQLRDDARAGRVLNADRRARDVQRDRVRSAL